MEQFQERRRRERGKYLVLRAYAKTVSALSYFAAVVVLFAGLVLLFGEMSLSLRVFYSLLILLAAGTYFVILQSAAQVIYLLFDLANSTRALRELLTKTSEGPPTPPGPGV